MGAEGSGSASPAAVIAAMSSRSVHGRGLQTFEKYLSMAVGWFFNGQMKIEAQPNDCNIYIYTHDDDDDDDDTLCCMHMFFCVSIIIHLTVFPIILHVHGPFPCTLDGTQD